MPSDTLITAPVQKSRFTVSTFYDTVRGNCGLRSSNRVTDADILGWLNEAQDEVATETHWYRTSGSISVTAGTKEYDLPTGLITVEKVWWNPLERRLIPMTPEDLEDLTQYSPDWLYASQGTPLYYYVNVNSAIGLHPTPDTTTASAVFLTYTALPPLASGSSDYLYHPAGWEKALIDYACWKASIKDMTGEGRQRVDTFRASWAERLAKIKRQVEGLNEENMTVIGEFGTPMGRSYRPRADWEDGSSIPAPG